MFLFIRQKTSSFLLFLLIPFLLWAGCDSADSDPDPVSVEGEVAILPIGDSRVQGARPEFESYRYELWKNLVAESYSIDFVGPEIDRADYPAFQGLPFDTNHAGIGGDRTTDVLQRLDDVLSSLAVPPDVVLLGIGGNDLLGEISPDEVIANVNTIIDRLQTENESVTIFLEQIAPARSDVFTPDLLALFNAFNAQIPAVASNQTTTSSAVVAINMFSDWSDAFMADQVHYNEAGAKEVADRYFAAMQANNVF